MKIPVFVSAPSTLNPSQMMIYNAIVDLLSEINIERRALGKSDYPTNAPMREVIRLAQKCSGGLILGFIQQTAPKVILKPGSDQEAIIKDVCWPTPWNNLEAGILFGLKLPMLVFKEKGISGGVFDNGATDVFLHKMPTLVECKDRNSPLREVLLKWRGEVSHHYYND